MKENLFPFATASPTATVQALPLYRDIALDRETGSPRFSGGEPVAVTGQEAVLSWVYRTLKTERYRYPHFSWDVGCELESLVGQPYREDTRRSEAIRYVQEALLVSPYIKAVQVSEAVFEGAELGMTVQIISVYGEGLIHV